MPLYEFQCAACENRWERIQKFTDPNPESCPKCGAGPVRKLPSSPAIQFKGSGFYITDYPKKSSSEASAAKPSGPSESSTSTGSSSDAKSDSKSPAAKSDSSSGSTKAPDSKSSDSKS